LTFQNETIKLKVIESEAIHLRADERKRENIEEMDRKRMPDASHNVSKP
jgi:hypothetical protein